MTVRLQGSSAEVYLHGAHVTSWKNNAGHVSCFNCLCEILRTVTQSCHVPAGADICQQAGGLQTT